MQLHSEQKLCFSNCHHGKQVCTVTRIQLGAMAFLLFEGGAVLVALLTLAVESFQLRSGFSPKGGELLNPGEVEWLSQMENQNLMAIYPIVLKALHSKPTGARGKVRG